MKDMVHAEKRREPRFREKIGLDFAVVRAGQDPTGEKLRAETLDVSEGGLRFHDDSGTIGFSMLEVALTPPGAAQPIIHFANVRWLGPAGKAPGNDVGVEFVFVQQTDRAAWENYIHQLLQKEAA